MIRILGIETSCDETAVAVVCDQEINKRILSNVVTSHLEPKDYGGVVPEIAARSHLRHLLQCYTKALQDANISANDIDAIAVTSGPGLAGGLLVGMNFAKGLAVSLNKPILAINHLEAHALTARLTHDVAFPYLLLLASGGHSQFMLVKDVGNYTLLGETLDDSAGECFDKCAKMMRLPYPGGPQIEQLALKGNKDAFALPIPLIRQSGCNLSFSGLKTAFREIITSDKNTFSKEDCAACLQKTISDHLINKLNKALKMIACPISSIVISGGVAANQYIRSGFNQFAQANNLIAIYPPIHLCTDNAAMIAWVGLERYIRYEKSHLDFKCQPRWPLINLN